MTTEDSTEPIRIIDCDTHIVEPPDLWTSRMSSTWGDLVPHVRWSEKHQQEAWFIGDRRLSPVAASAMAGWHEYPPLFPPRWSDADPVTWDATERLKRMDEDGVYAQVLYPNVALFGSGAMQQTNQPKFLLELVRSYNDYQVDFSEGASDRFVPIASLPFWDLRATIDEIERCHDLGHRGVVFTQDPSAFGLPVLTDRHWDRLWAVAQELQLPVNFHIASGDNREMLRRGGHRENGVHANFASVSVSVITSNIATISQLVCGGICHRFPRLDFVSVESGIGWLPFAIDALDWQWKNCGVHKEHPEYDLLPSEYFARQIYGCFWFEVESVDYVVGRLGADRILYETDFPHPTSMTPGPASAAIEPRRHREQAFARLDESQTRQILHDNASRLYRLT